MINKNEVVDFFNSLAPSWNDNQIINSDKINRIFDAAQVSEGKTVLDVACGTGVLTDWYRKRNVKSVLGVDISPCMTDIASAEYGSYDNVKFACIDAEEYVFDDKYDCVMIYNAFPHFISPSRIINNLYRATAENGTLTVAHDNGRKAIDGFHKGEASKISHGLMSEDELEIIFKQAGFKDIKKIADDEIYIVSGTK